MSKSLIFLVLAAALVGGAFFLISGAGGGDTPPPNVLEWTSDDEVETELADPAAGEDSGFGRTEFTSDVAAAGASFDNDDADRVTADVSGRVLSAEGAPLPGAKVRLSFSQQGRGFFGRAQSIPDPVITGEDGTFTFRGDVFRSLNVMLDVQHEAHARLFENIEVNDASTGQAPLGDVQLERGGRITCSVLDLGGNGIANAKVSLSPRGRDARTWMRMRARGGGRNGGARGARGGGAAPADDDLVANTDNNGYYVLEHVASGNYRATAEAKGYLRGDSDDFEAENNQSTEVEPIELGPGFMVTGTVVAASDNTPVAGARVRVASMRRGNNSARTDRDGKFAIDHLPGDELTLEVEKDDFLNLRVEDVDPILSGDLMLAMQPGLSVTGIVTDAVDGSLVTSYALRMTRVGGIDMERRTAEVSQLRDQMQALRSGSGDETALRATMTDIRTKLQELESNVEGRSGRRGGRGGGRGSNPFAAFQSNNVDQIPPPVRGMPSNRAEGRFEERGLQEGTYIVDIQSPNHARTRSAKFELRTGTAAAEVQIALPRGFTLTGRIADSQGAGIANAEVKVVVAPEEQQESANNNGVAQMFRRFRNRGTAPVSETKTDANGDYTLSQLPSGTFQLRAEAEGYARTSSDRMDLAADRANVNLTIDRLATLTGVVVGIPAGREAEARVVVFSPDAGFGGLDSHEVEPDGSYTVSDLQPGEYIARAYVGDRRSFLRSQMGQMFGGGEVKFDIVLNAGEVARLDITLVQADVVDVAGIVYLNGQPADDLRVSLQAATDPSQALNTGGRGGGRGGRRFGGSSANTNGDGSFTLEGILPGDYELSVRPQNARSAVHNQPLTVPQGGLTGLQIYATSGVVQGRITTTDGTDASGLTGVVTWQPGAEQGSGAQGNRANTTFSRIENGTYLIETAPEGTGVLTVRVRGRAAVTRDLTVTAGMPSTVDMEVGPEDPNAATPGGIDSGGTVRGVGGGGGRAGRGGGGGGANATRRASRGGEGGRRGGG